MTTSHLPEMKNKKKLPDIKVPVKETNKHRENQQIKPQLGSHGYNPSNVNNVV
jgi:hypothetical protein